jgi:hypothetical protein
VPTRTALYGPVSPQVRTFDGAVAAGARVAVPPAALAGPQRAAPVVLVALWAPGFKAVQGRLERRAPLPMGTMRVAQFLVFPPRLPLTRRPQGEASASILATLRMLRGKVIHQTAHCPAPKIPRI